MKTTVLSVTACGILLAWVLPTVAPARAEGAEDSPAATKPAQGSVLDRLPEAVRKTVQKEAGDHKIAPGGIERTTRKDKPVWAVEWMEGNKEVEIFVADDGTVVDREVKEIVPQPRGMTRLELRADMKKACALSEEQVSKIAALDEALDKAASKWQADNASKIQEAQKALFASRDSNAMLRAVQKLEELKKPYQEIVARAADDVQAILSAEQQAKWQEHAVIDLSINVWFARAKLTEAQQAAVKAAYAELAKARDAQVPAIQIALAEKVRDMLTGEQLKAMAGYLMQTEKSFQISTSGPSTVATGAESKSPASVDGGMLMLPVPKLLKTGVLVVMGGYGGITGPQAGGGSTIVSPEQGD